MESILSYEELAETLKVHFGSRTKTDISVRNLKYWVAEGLIPGPRGEGGRWLFFNEEDLEEVFHFLELRISYRQSLKDIRNIRFLSAAWLQELQEDECFAEKPVTFTAFVKTLERLTALAKPPRGAFDDTELRRNMGVPPREEFRLFAKHPKGMFAELQLNVGVQPPGASRSAPACAPPEKGRYVLRYFFLALQNAEKAGKSATEAIEAFKRHELALIYDGAYSPPFRLTGDEGLETVYLREGGRVYRLVDSITDVDGKVIYFKPVEIEKHLLDERERLREFIILQDDPVGITKKAEQIRALIDEKVMPAPSYRYNGEDYYSSRDIDCSDSWLRFMEDYGLDYAALRRLRERFEEDIARHFLTPDQGEGVFLASPEHYAFQKQVVFFNECLSNFRRELFLREDLIENHTKEDSVKLIEDYLEGFLFLYPYDQSICLKETPIEHLYPAQLAKGLEQHRFSCAQVEGIASRREQELRELRELLEDKGGEDGR